MNNNITAWINSNKSLVYIIDNSKQMRYCGKITLKQFKILESLTDDIIYHTGNSYFQWYKTLSGHPFTNNINDILV